MASNGAAHALVLCQPQVAIELLEQGRAVFWSQHLRLRTAFHALPSELAGKLAETAFILERHSHAFPAEEEQTADDNHTKAAHDIESAKRRRLGADFEALICQARAIPGFERFTLPERFQALSAASIQGPVVVFLANDVACEAIVIETPDTVHQVRLPDVSLQYLQTLSVTMGVAIRGGRDLLQGRAMKLQPKKGRRKTEELLEALWHKVIHKIIDALQIKV